MTAATTVPARVALDVVARLLRGQSSVRIAREVPLASGRRLSVELVDQLAASAGHPSVSHMRAALAEFEQLAPLTPVLVGPDLGPPAPARPSPIADAGTAADQVAVEVAALTVEELLERAHKSTRQRQRTDAARIDSLLDRVRRQLLEDERGRVVRARVAELRQQIATLEGRPTTRPAGARPLSSCDGSCGRTYSSRQPKRLADHIANEHPTEETPNA